MKKITCVIGVLFALLSSPVKAENAGQRAVVAVPAIAQLVHKETSGNWEGPLVDILQDVEKRTGVHFSLYVRSLKQAVEMTATGQSDFGVFMRSEARDQLATPLLKIAETSFVVISPSDKPVQKLIELKGKVLGRVEGGVPIAPIRAIDGISFYDFRTHEDGINLLKAGKIDALLTADFRMLDSINKKHISLDDIAWPLPVIVREIWLYGSHKSLVSSKIITTIMANMKNAVAAMDRTSLYLVYQRYHKK